MGVDIPSNSSIWPVLNSRDCLVGILPNPQFIKDVYAEIIKSSNSVLAVGELKSGKYGMIIIDDEGTILCCIEINDLKENACICSLANKMPLKLMHGIVEETKKQLIQDTLQRCRTTREMAAILGISQSAVVKKMKKYGIFGGDEFDQRKKIKINRRIFMGSITNRKN